MLYKFLNVGYYRHMDIVSKLYEQAKSKQGRILLPEATLDKRVMDACKILVKEELCNIVLIGQDKDFSNELVNSSLVKIINPNAYPRKNEMLELLVEKRKNKGLTHEEAEKWLQDTRYFATMLVEMGEADGMVLGAHYSSADALRPALQIIKAKKGAKVVGSMLMNRQDLQPLLFLDVSLNESPTSEDLATFGIEGAKFYESALGLEPKVAFLSYSTHGSADSEMVLKVRNATTIAKATSKYIIDGEMQFDSATVPSVASIKCPSATIKGDANVLVFPDLNAGNIGYKIAQRLGGLDAVGPIMLNFRYPVNDLSRGCSVKDIVDTVVITKLQIEDKI